jgi:hypothetical protein
MVPIHVKGISRMQNKDFLSPFHAQAGASL